MQSTINAITWRRVIYVAVGIALVVAAWIFVLHIPRTVAIFVVAAFIAFGVRPIIRRLERDGMSRPLAVTLVFTVLLLLIFVGLVVVVPLTISQLQVLANNLPAYIGTFQTWLSAVDVWLQRHIPGLRPFGNTFDIANLGSASLNQLAAGTLTSLGAILVSTATAFFVLFSAIVLSVFILLNDEQLSDGFASMFPVHRRETARKLGEELTETFGNYISGEVIVSGITGVVVAICSAVIGFKFSLILGLITAVGYSIPVIGMVIAQLIAIVLCAPQGGWMILWVQVIMFTMGRISDNILVPKVMGSSLGVSPIGVMFAVFAGGELFGIPGLILGVPAAALMKILWRYFVTPWLRSQLDRPLPPP